MPAADGDGAVHGAGTAVDSAAAAARRDRIRARGCGTLIKRSLLLAAVLLFWTMGRALALESEDVLQAQADALELDGLRQAAAEYAPDVLWTQAPDWNTGISSLLDIGAGAIQEVVRKALRSGVLLLAIVLLTSLADGASSCGTAKTIRAAPVAGALSITAVAVTDANTLIGLGRQAIDGMELFSKVLLPTVAAATAASGAPASAAAQQMATMLFSDILITMINRVFLPLLYVYIAACTAHASIGNEGLKRISSTLKWAVTSLLTIVLLAFVGYLTVSGVIAGSADAVTLKAAKFTVSSMVPVVGGILSDAAETVLAGACVLKNTVGVFGMLVILGMCVLPFLQLGVHYLVYKMTAALSSTVADSRISGLVDGIGGAFGLVLGMTGACALLMLVSMVSAIKVVST